MKHTAIFSGSFNPVHIGHLALANWICEYTDIDELWFLVSPQNPAKKIGSLLPDAYRLHLIQLVIGNYPKFKISDIEFSLPRPSYTIDTLTALSEAHPDREFSLVIGADSWNNFHLWKEYQRIIEKYRILVYPRDGHTLETTPKPAGVDYLAAPLMNISSTFIREAFMNHKDVRFFLPESLHKEIPMLKKLLQEVD